MMYLSGTSSVTTVMMERMAIDNQHKKGTLQANRLREEGGFFLIQHHTLPSHSLVNSLSCVSYLPQHILHNKQYFLNLTKFFT